MRSRLHAAVLAPLAALVLLFAQPAAQAGIDEELRATERFLAWRKEASDAGWVGDFDKLEQMFASVPGDAPFDRSWRVSAMLEGLRDSYNYRAGDAYYEQLEALTLENARARPDSALAHLLHVEALRNHAWQIRGGAYAREVPQSAWERFTALNRQALQYLQAHKEVVLRDARGYVALMEIGRQALNMKPEQAIPLFEAAAKLDPYDDQAYVEMLTAITPRWGGGTPEQVESFIRYASRLASPQWGHGMYARLYVYAFVVEYRHGLFEQTRVDWSEMKRGFEDLAVRTPSIRNRVRYTYFACMAKDRETYQAQMELLGQRSDLKRHIADAIGSNSERIWDDCRRWGSSS